MANGGDADLLEIVGGQVRKNVAVDRVVAERGFVLAETEVIQPSAEIHKHPCPIDDGG